CYASHLVLPSFPTRRSSDLLRVLAVLEAVRLAGKHVRLDARRGPRPVALGVEVAVRPFHRQLEAPLVEHRVAERRLRQPSDENEIGRAPSELQSLAYLVCRL